MGCFLSKLDPSTSNDEPKNGQISDKPDFGLANIYTIKKFLGQGAEGEAWLAIDNATEKEVAIKVIKRPLSVAALETIRLEAKIQAFMGSGCPNVVAAREAVLSWSHFGLVMEFVGGGNLAEYVTCRMPEGGEGVTMSEDEARYFFTQILNGMDYCHQRLVAHRDLKLDNLLLDTQDPPVVKLCDFGFSKSWLGDHNDDNDEPEVTRLKTMRVGTADYMPPELIKNESSKTGYDGAKADVWSAGVLLYVTLAARFPFDSEDDGGPPGGDYNQLTYNVWCKQHKGNWRMQQDNEKMVKHLSHDMLDLLDKVFELDPDKRLSVAGIRAHPWMTQPLPPKYSEALQRIAKEQEAAQKILHAAGLDVAFDDKKVFFPEMKKKVAEMMLAAYTRGKTADPTMRIIFPASGR